MYIYIKYRINGRNSKDLKEAEKIKKRWQEYTEQLFKKGVNDPDNHDGVVTHLEPDILQCEFKWAFGSITMNKASRGDGIPAELSQILKMMLLKCCTQYVSKFGKLCSGHRTGKGQFSSYPIPKKGNVEECSNCLTVELISHANKVMLKVLQATLQQYIN